MVRLEARLSGAFFGVMAVPLLAVTVLLGAWGGMIVALVITGEVDGSGARLLQGLGAVPGAWVGVRLLAELYAQRGGLARALAVITLAATAALGTWLSPLVPGRGAGLSAFAALVGTAAVTGGALLRAPAARASE